MSLNNLRRAHAVAVSRWFKDLFDGATAPRTWTWRRVFFSDDSEQLRRAGEAALTDLRDFCFANPAQRPAMFSNDPIVMARRVGRREVFDRIISYLNLDEAQVRKLMEIDDGE